MNTRERSKQTGQIFPLLKAWGSVALVFVLFGGYAYVLKAKESREQEPFLGELRYLRQENQSFIERILALEQQCETTLPEENARQESPPAEENAIDAATAAERSFVYHVKRGDTIWDIASIYQVDVESLMRWNNLTPRSRIFPGDQLTIILEE